MTGNCTKGEESEPHRTVEPQTVPTNRDTPNTAVEGGPEKPLPRKFSSTHEANFNPGHERPQGEGGLILNHIVTENASV